MAKVRYLTRKRMQAIIDFLDCCNPPKVWSQNNIRLNTTLDDSNHPLANPDLIRKRSHFRMNFPAYTNFAIVWNNVKFIWSATLVLDNLVLAKKTVNAPICTFTVDGNWNVPANWNNSKTPPATHNNGQIIIDQVAG